jgi:hypothetical protein
VVAPAAGSVVLVPFPFSDLSQAKLRPAAVLASGDRNDWVLCQVTSRPYGDKRALELCDSDFGCWWPPNVKLCASGEAFHRTSKSNCCGGRKTQPRSDRSNYRRGHTSDSVERLTFLAAYGR